MATGTSVPLVAAVSNTGGLGILGVTGQSATDIGEQIAAIRVATAQPFGVNFLLFLTNEANFAAALEARPPVVSFAWARPDQDLHHYVQRVHEAGLLAMYMAGEVPEAIRAAAAAGADVIVAQGTEGGGHVGWMASMALVPMVVEAVAPRPSRLPVASPMAAGWLRLSPSAPKGCCWGRASWPRRSRLCTRTSNRRLSRATAMIPC